MYPVRITRRSPFVAARVWPLLLGVLLYANTAAADDPATQREAGAHFQRAVQLYSEADYRSALVEFKRAYELSPNATVLYNLGQTHYQLQNYAEALSCFERFVADGGTQHRTEVENAIAVLKTRIGRVDITTASGGWEIAVDDEVVGKSPLAKPIAVSIGRRKITAMKAGESPLSRFVEVSAGETVPVNFALLGPPRSRSTEAPPTQEHGTSGLLVAGWIGTAALTAGAAVTGILAISAESKLSDTRARFPGDKSDIDAKASSTKTMALVADVLCASAVVLGGVTLYFTLTKPSSTTTSRIGASGSKLVFEGTF